MESSLVERSFSGHMRIMTLAGLHKPLNFNSRLYKIYGYAMYIVSTWIFPLLAASATLLDRNADINRITDTLFLLPQMWIITVKALPFLNKRDEINELLHRIQNGKFAPSSIEYQEIIESCALECRKVFTSFFYASFVAWVLWAAKPFFMEDKIVPMEILLPFELTNYHRAYIPIYLYIILAVFYGAMVNSSLDPLISGLLYHTSCQIKILKDKLSHVGLRADQAVLHIVDPKENELFRNDFISSQLRECIDHYDDIIRFIKDLEELFTYVPFIQLAASAVVICISCFQVMIHDPRTLSFFAMISFVVTMICQIFMYCHYGNELFHESSSVGNAVYMTDWYTFDKKSKRMMITLMERAKRPLVFKAGNLLPLSVDTFVSIMRKAYSLLAVLQNFK